PNISLTTFPTTLGVELDTATSLRTLDFRSTNGSSKFTELILSIKSGRHTIEVTISDRLLSPTRSTFSKRYLVLEKRNTVNTTFGVKFNIGSIQRTLVTIGEPL